MSYILDALRRADAERQRGQSPALQQVTAGPPWAPARGRPSLLRGLVPWLLLALLGAGAGVAWLNLREPMTVPSGERSPASSVLPPPAEAKGRASIPAAPIAPVQAPAVIPPVAQGLPRAGSETTPVSPAPVRAAPRPSDTSRSPNARATPPTPAAVAPRVSAPAPPTASAATPPVLHASLLAEPQRAAIKALGIGGAVHSPERGQSFVLVRGQIMREGSTLAPGITLERISPHLLLLRLGGQQIEWPL